MKAPSSIFNDSLAFVAEFLTDDVPRERRADGAKGALAAAAAVLESEAGFHSAQQYLVQLAEAMGENRDPSVNL